MRGTSSNLLGLDFREAAVEAAVIPLERIADGIERRGTGGRNANEDATEILDDARPHERAAFREEMLSVESYAVARTAMERNGASVSIEDVMVGLRAAFESIEEGDRG